MKINEILPAEEEEKQKRKDLFYTGLRDIDTVINGLAPGEIMLLSTPPSFEATALCIPAALFSAIKNNLKTLYLTSERPAYLAKRLSSIEDSFPLYVEPIEGVSFIEIDENTPSEMEIIFHKYAYDEPAEETKKINSDERHTRAIPAWLVIVDSIDYIYKYYPKHGDYEEMRCEILQNAVKEIKRLAKKYNAAVIISAQALTSWPDESAELSMEVASCVPLVDILCLLNRDQEEYLKKANLEVLKNIKSIKGTIILGIDQESRLLIDCPMAG
jgi:replicative DNA helicase